MVYLLLQMTLNSRVYAEDPLRCALLTLKLLVINR